MKERFEGKGRENLVEALRRQVMVNGDRKLAEDIAEHGHLEEFKKGDALVTEGGSDNDLFFIVAGTTAVVVKQNNIATRTAGQTVGEMAAVEPAQPRSATVIALETVVAVRLPNDEFQRIGSTFPQIWQPLASDLSRRLYERNKLLASPNEAPKLFVVSSAEALEVAWALQKGLDRSVAATVWTDGVFFAGGYPLEHLERAVEASDFAVAIAQPDDIVTSKGKRSPTLRDNVLFELGLFMGKLTRFRTILIHPRVKDLKLPSDLQGLTLLSYEPCDPDDLPTRLGPVCSDIRTLVRRLGVFKRGA